MKMVDWEVARADFGIGGGGGGGVTGEKRREAGGGDFKGSSTRVSFKSRKPTVPRPTP